MSFETPAGLVDVAECNAKDCYALHIILTLANLHRASCNSLVQTITYRERKEENKRRAAFIYVCDWMQACILSCGAKLTQPTT